ncbi:histidine phosphatase family protein [Gordonia sp. NPDC003585]|uniref:histidine phosphatase family protein n=1 Tax=Gordonia sp. NPDC003585 TaxID=3154275 RepID=UPI0033B76796
MQIITAGRTGPNRDLRFGGDLSLDDAGRRTVNDLRRTVSDMGRTVSGPETVALETSALLSGQFDVDDALRTMDFGEWAGKLPEEIDPSALGLWFSTPDACPHGGETVADFVARIHDWRASATFGVCVVSMPVAQALLVDDAAGYFAIEVRPATSYQL